MKNVKIEYVDASTLKTAEYNPRMIKKQDFKDLKKSIETFGLVDPLLVNKHKGRENILIGGHQRLKAAKSLGIENVPVVFLDLELDKEKELNLRLNKNKGEFDKDLLKEFFSGEFLAMVGFTDKALLGIEDKFQKRFESFNDKNCEMPIVPQYAERYDSVIIFSNCELDFNWLKNFLNIQKKKSYKSKDVGECMVMTVAELQKVVEEMS